MIFKALLLLVLAAVGDSLVSRQLTYTVGYWKETDPEKETESPTGQRVIQTCAKERSQPLHKLQCKNFGFPNTRSVQTCHSNYIKSDSKVKALSFGLNSTYTNDHEVISYFNIDFDKLNVSLTCGKGNVSIEAIVAENGQMLCRIHKRIPSAELRVFHLFYKVPAKTEQLNGAVFLTTFNGKQQYENCSFRIEGPTQDITLDLRYVPDLEEPSRDILGKSEVSVLMADIIDATTYERIDDKVRQEYEYLQLLYKGAPNPECLCPQETPDCSDPAQRMTGTDKATYYLPISGLHDGVLNPKNYSRRYGYWAAPNTNVTIVLTLKDPALITGMKLYLTNQSFSVYKQELGTNSLILATHHMRKTFGLANVEYTSSNSSTCEWKYVNWNESRVITDRILINLPGDRVVDYNIYPNSFRLYNMLYEIIVIGRPLLPSDPAQCECFPGNGKQPEGCDDRDQCRCRKGMESDRICSPYVTHVTPHYGPVSGGTLLTLHGGLLKPHLDIDISARVTLAGNIPCSVEGEHSLDDRVVCRTMAGSAANTSLPLKVELVLAGFPYKIHNMPQLNFTYLPDPSIGEILTPQPICRNKQTHLKFTGSHLDVSNNMLLSNRKLRFHANCTGTDRQSVGCIVPEINYHGDDIVEIDFILDGKNLKTFNLSLHPEPSLNSEARITDDWNIAIGGSNLDLCHALQDYTISLGKVRCSITHLDKSHIRCSLAKSDVLENKDLNISVAVDGRIVPIQLSDYMPLDQHNQGIHAIMAVLVTGVLALVVIAIGLTRKYRKSSANALSPPPHVESIQLNDTTDTNTREAKDQRDILADLKPTLQKVIRPRLLECEHIEKHKRIGKGNFGKVFHGTITLGGEPVSVALKTLKDGTNSDKEDIEEFLKEATIMKDFCHPNVLCLIGVILTDLDIFVVLPYMVNGDLRKYIARQMFDFQTFHQFTLDVAKGMAYLASKRFVHRDLAARNCMVNAAGVVLIGDFGLAKDIYVADYYRPDNRDKPMPFKWMAPECLEEQVFTTKSDTWAYGITMWEIYTQGDRPYLMVDNLDLHTYLLRGNRLKKPDNCPETVFQIMIKCWHLQLHLRPTFADLVDLLTETAKEVLATAKVESMSASSRSLTSICQSSTPENNSVFLASESQCPLLYDSDWAAEEDDMPDYLAPEPSEEECEGAVGGAPAHAATISSQDLAAIAAAMREGSSPEDDAGYLKPVSTILQPLNLPQRFPQTKHNILSKNPGAIAAALREESSPEDDAGYLKPVSTRFQTPILTLPRRFPETKE